MNLLVQHAARARRDNRLLGRSSGTSDMVTQLEGCTRKRTAPLELANTIRPFAILKERAAEAGQAVLLWREARDLYLAVNVQEGVAECSEHLTKLGG